MTDELRKHMRDLGRKGGKKTAKRGKAFYSRIGKQGMKKRWEKRTKLANTASE
jgi:general stress protein YciG